MHICVEKEQSTSDCLNENNFYGVNEFVISVHVSNPLRIKTMAFKKTNHNCFSLTCHIFDV